MGSKTMLLNRGEVMRLLDPSSLVALLSNAFQLYCQEQHRNGHRVSLPLVGSNELTVLAPGLTGEVPAFSLKAHLRYPGESPVIKGMLHLYDLRTGNLLALMDSTYITAVRTSLTAALASDLLAHKKATSAAIIGAGVQGWYQLRFLLQMRQLDEVYIFDIVKSRADKFAELLESRSDLKAVSCGSLSQAVEAASIVLCATWSREPFLALEMVSQGSHVTTLGSDSPGKRELHPDLLKECRFFCDDSNLAVERGAIGSAGLTEKAIYAELGEVLAGKKKGRTRKKQITVYGAVGLPLQDLLAAWQVYRAARRHGVGRTFDFLG